MEAVILIDVIRRAGAAVVVASVEPGREVTCSRGVKLVADALIGELAGQSFDLIACPVRGSPCAVACRQFVVRRLPLTPGPPPPLPLACAGRHARRGAAARQRAAGGAAEGAGGGG
jgi:hypothetical protein